MAEEVAEEEGVTWAAAAEAVAEAVGSGEEEGGAALLAGAEDVSEGVAEEVPVPLRVPLGEALTCSTALLSLPLGELVREEPGLLLPEPEGVALPVGELLWLGELLALPVPEAVLLEEKVARLLHECEGVLVELQL